MFNCQISHFIATKDDTESSDDEPLIKKTKKSPPTDNEIVALVKELLDGADLEKITMKSVCKQVRKMGWHEDGS